MPASTRWPRWACGAALALGVSLASPATPGPAAKPAGYAAREAFTAADLAQARPEGSRTRVRLPGDDPAAFQAVLRDAAMAGREPWLVLSSGGENGAFAAGLLTGWSEAGTRPDFGVVTGVSTGALIAPFAFVGRSGNPALENAYTTTSAADVFELGGTVDALTDSWPLQRQIKRNITPALLADVAAEHGRGRRLLVVTTELDSGRPVLWDMGALAAEGSPEALKLFRAVLLASAAVPGLFPPVMIDVRSEGGRRFQEMHADGGIAAPFFVAPAATLLAADPDRIPASAVYIVVNHRLGPEFQVAQRTVLGVLGRALSAATKAQVAGALALTRAYAARTGLPLHVALIDERLDKASSAQFDAEYMRALFTFGRDTGSAGTAFDWKRGSVLPNARRAVPETCGDR